VAGDAYIGKLMVDIGMNVARLQADARKMNAEMRSMSSQMSSAFSAARSAVNMLGVGIAGISFGVVVKELIETQTQVDAMNNKLRYATGGISGLEKAQALLRKESDRLGLKLMDASDGLGSFSAAAKNTSMEGYGAEQAFLAVAEASTVMSMSSEQTHGAMKALEQIMSKGKVQAEELRGQLGERIPGAFQIAARAMNMTTAELDKFMAEGNITANQFLPRFAAQLRKEMAGEIAASSQSARSNINRLDNAWLDLKTSLLDAGFASGLTTALKAISAQLKDMTKHAREWSEEQKRLKREAPYGLGGADSLDLFGYAPPPQPLDSKRQSVWGAPKGGYGVEFGSETFRRQALMGSEEGAQRMKGHQQDAAKAFKDSASALDLYNTKLMNYKQWLDMGMIAQDDFTRMSAIAREEYQKGAPAGFIQEQTQQVKALSDTGIAAITAEMNKRDELFSQGKLKGQEYYQGQTQLVKEQGVARIRALQEEKEAAKKLLTLELESPTKSEPEKGLALQKFATLSMQIEADIANAQTSTEQSLAAIRQQAQSTADALTSTEANLIREILDLDQGSVDQRKALYDEYTAYRIKQIESEAEKMKREGANADLIKRWVESQKNQEYMAPWKSSASELTELRSIQEQYAELTGSIQEIAKAKMDSVDASVYAFQIEHAGNEKLIAEYRQLAEEKKRRENLQANGSFGEGFMQAQQDWARTAATPAQQGAEAFNAFRDSIESTADALTDFAMTGKMDFANFANSIVRSLMKIMVQAMITKAVTAAFNLFSGGTGGLGSPFSPESGISLAGGYSGKANGGYFSANQDLLVGERGPERVRFGRSGSITPNHALNGGSSGPNVSVSVVYQAPQGGQHNPEDAKRMGNEVKKAVKSAMDEYVNNERRSGGQFGPRLMN
jgi:lambda family phage tail tape measure protein